jgi:hypothetical protein
MEVISSQKERKNVTRPTETEEVKREYSGASRKKQDIIGPRSKVFFRRPPGVGPEITKKAADLFE